MANLNKVMLIGRLTRDPEIRVFSNGGKVAKIGFAVNNRKKNPTTGEWENEPVFVDIEAFNREKRQLADLAEQYLRKGHQAYIEGHLKLDQWTSQDGQKHSKLKIVLDNVEFLEPRKDGGEGGRYQASAPPMQRPAASPPANYYESGPDMEPPDTLPGPGMQSEEENLPF